MSWAKVIKTEMKYFLDTEFNEFGGEIISLALVREDGEAVYFVFGCDQPGDWVKEHVMPFLYSSPKSHADPTITTKDAAVAIQQFLKNDSNPIIIADWPDDIKYFCELLITGPGMMVGIAALTFQMIRVNAYPTMLKGAIQHNAYWDAMALKCFLIGTK